MAVMTYIEAINAALDEEMERDPLVFVLGEEYPSDKRILTVTDC